MIHLKWPLTSEEERSLFMKQPQMLAVMGDDHFGTVVICNDGDERFPVSVACKQAPLDPLPGGMYESKRVTAAMLRC